MTARSGRADREPRRHRLFQLERAVERRALVAHRPLGRRATSPTTLRTSCGPSPTAWFSRAGRTTASRRSSREWSILVATSSDASPAVTATSSASRVKEIGTALTSMMSRDDRRRATWPSRPARRAAPRVARSSIRIAVRIFCGFAPPSSWVPRLTSPATTATTDRPSSDTPLTWPLPTRQARIASRPAHFSFAALDAAAGEDLGSPGLDVIAGDRRRPAGGEEGRGLRREARNKRLLHRTSSVDLSSLKAGANLTFLLTFCRSSTR